MTRRGAFWAVGRRLSAVACGLRACHVAPLRLALAAALAGCVTEAQDTRVRGGTGATAATSVPGYGLARETPIEVCTPVGESEYLHRLRCPDGTAPDVLDRGGAGPRNTPADPNDPRLLSQLDFGLPLEKGEPDYHIVDAIQLGCPSWQRAIFIDMYHCNPKPAVAAPRGLKLDSE